MENASHPLNHNPPADSIITATPPLYQLTLNMCVEKIPHSGTMTNWALELPHLTAFERVWNVIMQALFQAVRF